MFLYNAVVKIIARRNDSIAQEKKKTKIRGNVAYKDNQFYKNRFHNKEETFSVLRIYLKI